MRVKLKSNLGELDAANLSSIENLKVKDRELAVFRGKVGELGKVFEYKIYELGNGF